MIRIMCVTPSAGGGWAPVTAMATLMGECFDAPVSFVHPARDYSRARRALSLVPRRRGSKGHLLLIAARPGDLLALVGGPAHLAGFDSVSAWIFDAFWDEEIPRMARRAGFVDQFFIPDAELVDVYASATRTPVAWLPWGTDTLAGQAGRFSGARAYDVLRLGRQPAVLDDDTVTSLALQKHRRTFWRCPPFNGDGSANHATVRNALEASRVVLASGNASSPGDYTHPTREYITARWCDAVAAGTIVAGIPPQCEATTLLPDEGLWRIALTDTDSAVEGVSHAVAAWTPELAGRLHRHARDRLDWRLRFDVIREVLGVPAMPLYGELSRLHEGP